MKNMPKEEIDYLNYKMDDINSYKSNSYFDNGNSKNDFETDNNQIKNEQRNNKETYSVWHFIGEAFGILLEILD